MITGRVNSRLEATTLVRVFGPTGQVRDVTTVIDTGYSGSLTLPMALVRHLSLAPHVARRVRLADGSRLLLDSYLADVEWDGKRCRIIILSTGGTPLLGVTLLRSYHLGVDFEDGGAVSISALP